MNALKLLISVMDDIGYFERHADVDIWDELSTYFQELPKGFIQKYVDKLNWKRITEVIFHGTDTKFLSYNMIPPNMEFIDLYKDYINWDYVSEESVNVDISNLIEKYPEKFNFSLFESSKISRLKSDLIIKHKDDFNFVKLSHAIVMMAQNPLIHLSESFILHAYEYGLLLPDMDDKFWSYLSEYLCAYSIPFLNRYRYHIQWDKLSYVHLSIRDGNYIFNFIEEFKDELDWEELSRHIVFPLEKFEKYIEYIYPYFQKVYDRFKQIYLSDELKTMKKIYKKEKRRRFFQKLKGVNKDE